MKRTGPGHSSRRLRWPAFAVIALLLFCGCAAKAPPASGGASGPSSIPSASPTPKQPATTGDPEVVATVRAYLQADGDRNYQRMASLSVGTIHDLWSWYDADLGSCTCPIEQLSIDHIKVVGVHGNDATVDLRATLIASDHTTVFTGPMTLVRPNVGWYVADYRRNGTPFAETISVRSASASASGLTVSVIGILRDRLGEDVWLRIVNARAGDVAVVSRAASLGSTALTPWTYRPGIQDIRTGSMVTDIEWGGIHTMVAGRPLHIQLVLLDLQTGSKFPISLNTLS